MRLVWHAYASDDVRRATIRLLRRSLKLAVEIAYNISDQLGLFCFEHVSSDEKRPKRGSIIVDRERLDEYRNLFLEVRWVCRSGVLFDAVLIIISYERYDAELMSYVVYDVAEVERWSVGSVEDIIDAEQYVAEL